MSRVPRIGWGSLKPGGSRIRCRGRYRYYRYSAWVWDDVELGTTLNPASAKASWTPAHPLPGPRRLLAGHLADFRIQDASQSSMRMIPGASIFLTAGPVEVVNNIPAKSLIHV